MRKNKILGRVAACVAAGVLVLSSCTACGVNIYSTMDDKIDLVIEGEKNIAQISSIVGSPVASLTSKDNVLVVRYKNGASYTSGIKRDGCKLIFTNKVTNTSNVLSDQQVKDVIC